MADKKAPVQTDTRFVDMTFNAKLVFIGKVIVFLISGGFIFPTVWTD